MTKEKDENEQHTFGTDDLSENPFDDELFTRDTTAKLRSDNTSGITGVSRRKDRKGLWQVHTFVDGKKKLVGHTRDFDEAVAMRIEAEKLKEQLELPNQQKDNEDEQPE